MGKWFRREDPLMVFCSECGRFLSDKGEEARWVVRKGYMRVFCKKCGEKVFVGERKPKR